MQTVFVFAYFYLILYSFLGWICECAYVGIPRGHFINRGFFYGPYIPIYGFGSLIALYPLLPFQSYPIVIFFLGAILCSILEYVTSWVMEKLFHMRWWDYSSHKYNLNGRVCLLNSTLFGMMLLALVYFIHPICRNFVEHIPYIYIEIFLVIFTILFSVDFVFTLISLIRRKRIIDKMRADIEEFQVQFEENMQRNISEFEEKMEQIQEQKEKRRKEFETWLSEQESLEQRLETFHANMERFKKLRESHIAKAFPERHISKDFRELKRIADEIHERWER